MTAALADLLAVPTAPAGFRAPAVPQRAVFGGQLVGQAMWAAGRAARGGRLPHAVHLTFLAPPDGREPLDLRVRSAREDPSLAEVSVDQERTVASAVVGLGEPTAPSRGAPPSGPPLAATRSLGDLLDAAGERRRPGWWSGVRPAELRYPALPPQFGGPGPARHAWVRCADALPGDPLMHACALGWASDLVSFDVLAARHPTRPARELTMVSLCHHVWLHGRARADGWLRVEQDCPAMSDGIGLVTARWFDTGGVQVATVVQEALVKVREEQA